MSRKRKKRDLKKLVIISLGLVVCWTSSNGTDLFQQQKLRFSRMENCDVDFFEVNEVGRKKVLLF